MLRIFFAKLGGTGPSDLWEDYATFRQINLIGARLRKRGRPLPLGYVPLTSDDFASGRLSFHQKSNDFNELDTIN